MFRHGADEAWWYTAAISDVAISRTSRF